MNRAARRQAGDPARRRLGPLAHDPVVVILALIAFFPAISGKPLDGLLILLVAFALQVLAARTQAPVPPGWHRPARRRPARLAAGSLAEAKG